MAVRTVYIPSFYPEEANDIREIETKRLKELDIALLEGFEIKHVSQAHTMMVHGTHKERRAEVVLDKFYLYKAE